MKIVELHKIITKICKIKELHVRINRIMKIIKSLSELINNDNHGSPSEVHGSQESHRIPIENHENH